MISATPTDEACSGSLLKQEYDGEKWIGYRCADGKVTKIEYEIIEPEISRQQEDEVLEESMRDLDWEQKRAAEKYKRGLLQQRQWEEIRKREQIAKDNKSNKCTSKSRGIWPRCIADSSNLGSNRNEFTVLTKPQGTTSTDQNI